MFWMNNNAIYTKYGLTHLTVVKARKTEENLIQSNKQLEVIYR